MPEENGGSFSLGFTFGLLAGASGFFIFGTERGKHARKQFSKQWKEAHASLAKNSDEPLLTLRDAYNHVVAAVLDEKPSVVVHKKKSVKKRKKQTFTGT